MRSRQNLCWPISWLAKMPARAAEALGCPIIQRTPFENITAWHRRVIHHITSSQHEAAVVVPSPTFQVDTISTLFSTLCRSLNHSLVIF